MRDGGAVLVKGLGVTGGMEVLDLGCGYPMTVVAHDAGFADSARFGRTFKRMFGISPTSLRML